jgi:hypothetical protein
MPTRPVDVGHVGEVAGDVRVGTCDGIAADPENLRTVDELESGGRPKEMNG